MRTQNPLVATPCGFKSHHRHQPLKPLVSLFFGEQAVFLLRVQKTGLAFRLLFFVCHFAKWPKPSSIIFKYKKLFSYKTIFSCGLNWFFSHLFWKLQRQAVIGDPRGFILMLHIQVRINRFRCDRCAVSQPFLYFLHVLPIFI